jgi:hypothetical protein
MNTDKVTVKVETADISHNDEISNVSGIQQYRNALVNINRFAEQVQEKVFNRVDRVITVH